MRYELPRYIEDEAKIAGPLNIKQFFIFFGAGVVCAMLFFFLKTPVAVFLSIIILGTTALIVFGRYKGRPIHAIIGGVMKYLWEPRTYIWQKQAINPKDLYQEKQQMPEPEEPADEQKDKQITHQELEDLARKLDKKQ